MKRYLVRPEWPADTERAEFDCQACAVLSVRPGVTRLLIDRVSGVAFRVWKQNATTYGLVRVNINARFEVTEAYGLPLTFALKQGTHAEFCAERTPDTFTELATIASVERYLKEALHGR